uniref:Uncharacterized protein n=1 Tax=Polysiphonia sp. TaxID=1967842 RepID=A0A1Z1M4E9_9FLOR|nr:hypothetical protein [Polysiphonia sp.]
MLSIFLFDRDTGCISSALTSFTGRLIFFSKFCLLLFTYIKKAFHHLLLLYSLLVCLVLSIIKVFDLESLYQVCFYHRQDIARLGSINLEQQTKYIFFHN